jgi:hypothetical protein
MIFFEVSLIQDIEFTVQEGELYILETIKARRSPQVCQSRSCSDHSLLGECENCCGYGSEWTIDSKARN